MRTILVHILFCVASAKATDDTDPDINLDTIIPDIYQPKNIMTPKVDKSTSRIIGGGEATPHAFPYMVFLLFSKGGGQVSCGGALISKQTVLTAAHCIDGAFGPVGVILGAHHLKKSESTKQRFTTSKYFFHKGWDQETSNNDIGIVHLPSPAELTSAVQLIAVARDPSQDYTNHDAVLNGWGRTSSALPQKTSDILKTAMLPIVSNSVCNVAYSNMIKNNHVCVSGLTGNASCHGDSGGPLVLDGVQIGIVSFGSMGCEMGWPSVYTRVTSYLDWIDENTI